MGVFHNYIDDENVNNQKQVMLSLQWFLRVTPEIHLVQYCQFEYSVLLQIEWGGQ